MIENVDMDEAACTGSVSCLPYTMQEHLPHLNEQFCIAF